MEGIFQSGALKGCVAFITGGGSGINLEIGRALGSLGASIGICGRNADRLEGASNVLRAKGADVFTAVADVRDFDAVQSAMDGCRDALGPVTFLVCGAAGNFLSPAESMSANGFKTVIDIDLMGAFNAARAGFEQLKETRGSILFISGGQSWVPFAYQAHVGAAKAGIDNLMANLALEWGPYGIRSNSIVPGPIEGTEGMQRMGGDEQRDIWEAMTPLGRMGRAQEVAAMAAFLASPAASFVSGARIPVDGGQNLTGSHVFNAAIAKQFNRANP
ncbi:2,4-dienoyl-CoA reductase (NADPH) [Sphingobium chlorophenolicum L-1]|uniref:2,4-dienoyl-CoA reductase (NADPH) n=1 Tax=Sphingobium chlorophenolicum L-1 TaxID=690566 RepID=F6EUI2_SPHCR|nr:SDR family oxidoreductase [Sphingobium chlorophenolicum]AEG47876.1 2,4-dienoyl-CoA reductase (NADPH) [Sphingobium chlorophenolicum L-1]